MQGWLQVFCKQGFFCGGGEGVVVGTEMMVQSEKRNIFFFIFVIRMPNRALIRCNNSDGWLGIRIIFPGLI